VIALSQFNSDRLNSHRRGGGRFVVAVVAALAAAPAAFAGDVLAPAYTRAPAPIATDWTGFYLGAGIGARSSQVDGNVSPSSLEILRNCGPSIACTGEPLNDTAFRISPYFGYNYQFATQWLAGIEGDVGFGSKTTTIAGVFGPNSGITTNFGNSDSFAVKTAWDASVRGRLGYLVTPSFLVYGTGGAAWQHLETTSTCMSSPTFCFPGAAAGGYTPTVSDSMTKLGFTVGVGVETMLSRNWIVRGEYRYADFGTITNTETHACVSSGGCAPSNLAITDTLRLRTQTATFGIAYKFGQ
jgi:outer membrane immunogenic protein